MTYEKEKGAAVEAVIRACGLCRDVQSSRLSRRPIEKGDGSPVTVADFGSQAVIASCLRESFPRDPLVGEESTGLLLLEENAPVREAVVVSVRRVLPHLDEKRVLESIDRGAGQGGSVGRFWTLDPIDGTKGFLRGDQYAVALALVEDGRLVLGVLGCPNLPVRASDPEGPRGLVLSGIRGEGATVRELDTAVERRIRVSAATLPTEAVFCESFDPEHSSHRDSARVMDILGSRTPPIRMDGQCKYGIVALGEASVYLRLPTRRNYIDAIWDHAAGTVLVEEAGGRVTDLDGKALDFSLGRRLSANRGVVVTNRTLHDPVLKAVQKVLQ